MLILIAGFVLFQGSIWLISITTAVSLVCAYELLRAIRLHRERIGIIAYVFIIVYNFMLYMEWEKWFVALFIALLLILLTFYVGRYPKYTTEQITMIFFIFFYTGVLLSYIYQVRYLENGRIIVWLVLISAWGSDTFAYIVGMMVGKHKLQSELSPKKTIEGCIGGVIGAALIGFLFSYAYPQGDSLLLSPHISFPIICTVGSVVSQVGDLAASAVKRNHGVKDYGDIIPGHGGILDRFDSILFVSPVVYYLLVLMFKP
jgi:phosphatidate cytidylyltransferase